MFRVTDVQSLSSTDMAKYLPLNYSCITFPECQTLVYGCLNIMMVGTPLGKKEGKNLLLIVDTNVNKTLKRGPAMKTSSITQQHTNNKQLSSNQETPIVSIA